jgi:hypothetical protein
MNAETDTARRRRPLLRMDVAPGLSACDIYVA